MNNYEEWAQLVAKNLKGEADLIAAIDKDELDDSAATQAFIRAVLDPFIPESFGIGSGRVVDAFGNYSDHLDIIIYNRDYPRIGIRGTHAAYLYESVLAVFSIRAKFIRKTFFDALTACASVADLNANIDKLTMAKLAKKNGLTRDANNRFVHRDSLRSERFHLIGRPPAFVFGFTGIKQSYRQLQENIELWIEQRRKAGSDAEMKSLPAVIATQGCFAWRNAAPLALSNREMMGIGNDDAPVRLIVLQLLYLLNRRLNVASDAYGLKPSLKAYLSQFSPPKFEMGVGSLDGVVSLTPDSGSSEEAQDAAPSFEAAFDRAPIFDSAPSTTAQESEPLPEPELPSSIGSVEESAPIAASLGSAPKTAPLGSAPIPMLDEPAAPKTAPLGSAPIPPLDEPTAPKTAPLGSAPIPPLDEPTAPKTAPLGSAPIPPLKESAVKESAPKPKSRVEPAANIIPPKPPVDFDLTAETEAPELANTASKKEPEQDFAQTVVVPPSDGDNDDGSRNSTDAFIARVKEQLSSSDPVEDPDKQQDSFSSTIPQ